MKIRFLLALALLVALVLPGVAAADRLEGSDHGGRPLSATLVPAGGNTTGSGTARFTVNPGQEEICFELTVTGIAPAFAAHIHEVSTGGIVVPLAAPTSGVSSGCVHVDRELAKAIMHNPEAFFVNVHNTPFPRGALSGLLTK